jgi:hypothetical protein
VPVVDPKKKERYAELIGRVLQAFGFTGLDLSAEPGD